MKITTRDIAARCGVSASTVHKILRYPEAAFRPQTRKRVLRAAVQMGYRPNQAALSVRTGRFDAVVLLQDTSRRSLESAEFAHTLCEAFEERDVHLILARFAEERLAGDGRTPKVFRQVMADGLILDYHCDVPAAVVAALDRLKLPWILINNRRRHDCVYPDEGRAGREATEALLQRGHRRVAYLDYSFCPKDAAVCHFSRLDRLAGYRAAMKAARLPARLLTAGARPRGDEVERLHAFMRSFLQAPDRPTGIVVYSGAEELVWVAASEQRLRIPQDLSLVVLDRPTRVGRWNLAHVPVPWERIAREAAAMLGRKIEDPAKPQPAVVVQARMVEGETLAPPPSGMRART